MYPGLAVHQWGGHATTPSLKGLIKDFDLMCRNFLEGAPEGFLQGVLEGRRDLR